MPAWKPLAREVHKHLASWRCWSQVLVSGVLLGGLYALMALGLALVWGVLNIVNLSHGALIMLGAYVTYFLFTGAHIDPFAALPITAVVLFASAMSSSAAS